jgi:hypothetical protein
MVPICRSESKKPSLVNWADYLMLRDSVGGS